MNTTFCDEERDDEPQPGEPRPLGRNLGRMLVSTRPVPRHPHHRCGNGGHRRVLKADWKMLVLTRKLDEGMSSTANHVTVLKVQGQRIQLGIEPEGDPGKRRNSFVRR